MAQEAPRSLKLLPKWSQVEIKKGSKIHQKSILGRLGASWERLGASWERLGRVLGLLGRVLARLGRVLGRLGRVLGRKTTPKKLVFSNEREARLNK